MREVVVRYRKPLIAATTVLVLYSALGFLLAPWLVEKNAVKAVRENLGAELRLGKVAINPFVLSLRIDGLEFDDPDGLPFARVEQIFVNFQLSSLFRWALTFDEVRLDVPELFMSRDAAGDMNIAFLTAGSSAKTEADTSGESAIFPLLVFNFAINNSALNWTDLVPVDPVKTRFGPVNIAIANLNTLADRSGQQDVVITTETSGTLSWSGTLQLNPLYSEGSASIKGSHFPLVSAYMRHEIGFDAVEGIADVALDYRVASRPDGSLEASVDDFNLQFQDVLVRTFSPADDAKIDRDVLELPSLKLAGGSFSWPEKTVSIAEFELNDASLSLFRNEAGALNIIPQRSVDVEGVPDQAPVEEPSDWQFSLHRLALNRMAVQLEDHSVQPVANLGVESLSVAITAINNNAGSEFPTALSLLTGAGGTLTMDGTLAVLPEPLLDLEVVLDDLPLAAAHPYVKPLANVSLDSGRLSLSSRLQSSPADRLQLDGDLTIVDFLITETNEGSRLGSWDRVAANNIAFSSAGKTLNIAEIQLQKPYGDILIAADGSLNLGRVKKSDAADDVEKGSDSGSSLAVTIGKVVIEDAAMDFADLSLPLPFSAKIADLNGDMSTIATDSSEPSTVALEGKVDEFGFVRVSGFITPLETSRNTDMKVAFQNVEMPKLSSYTIPFAGREIANGKLDLDLGYKVTASELVGENKIVLRDLQLGDKVDHPGAASLPLGLAVALLKDADGKIDIDLPVRGNVDDPEFRYGSVVLKALGGLIVKIVASPFALLGNLLGVEASELEYITFLPGRSDLTPPELERAGKLAEALRLRPELFLELNGVIDREADGLALKTEKLDALLALRSDSSADPDLDAVAMAEQQTKTLEAIFSEMSSSGDATNALEAMRLQFTTAPTDTQAAMFDAVAYYAELRRQTIEVQALSDDELAALANDRSANISDAIVTVDAGLLARIRIRGPQAIEARDEETVSMKVKMSIGDDDTG